MITESIVTKILSEVRRSGVGPFHLNFANVNVRQIHSYWHVHSIIEWLKTEPQFDANFFGEEINDRLSIDASYTIKFVYEEDYIAVKVCDDADVVVDTITVLTFRVVIGLMIESITVDRSDVAGLLLVIKEQALLRDCVNSLTRNYQSEWDVDIRKEVRDILRGSPHTDKLYQFFNAGCVENVYVNGECSWLQLYPRNNGYCICVNSYTNPVLVTRQQLIDVMVHDTRFSSYLGFTEVDVCGDNTSTCSEMLYTGVGGVDFAESVFCKTVTESTEGSNRIAMLELEQEVTTELNDDSTSNRIVMLELD